VGCCCHNSPLHCAASCLGLQDGYSSSQLDDGAAYSSGAGNNGSSGGRPAFAGPIVQSGAPAAAPAAAAAAAAGAGGQHAAAQRLVERICTPAGLRAAPSREDTAAFVDSITALDGPTVAQLLQRKLVGVGWLVNGAADWHVPLSNV
jgi:hypothetical protein